jgi:hypothetical protein
MVCGAWRVRFGRVWLAGVVACLCGSGWCARAGAVGCVNEALREKQVHGSALPDCRAYEQVSPVDTNDIDAKGFPGNVQASPSGERIRYFSVTPFAGGESPSGGFPVYISSRVGRGEWATEDIIPQGVERASALGYSEDLSEAVVWTEGEGAALTEGAPLSGRDFYIRYNGTGGYRLIAGGLKETGTFEPLLVVAGFSGDGSHLVFESEEDLLPGEAVAGAVNVYEVDLAKPQAEQLSLVGVLPAGEGGGPPAGGSVAGEGSLHWASFPGHYDGLVYTQSAISGDGSRVVFTSLPSERLYVRENAGEPASPVNGGGECTAPADACTVAVSAGAAHFREMTPDGGFVFYSEGEDLYRFDVGDGVREALSTGAAGVLGVLGSSADGSAVYFTATGVLAANENEHHEKAAEGGANLYEWHEAVGGAPRVTFIAPLADFLPDERDWSDELGGVAPGLQKSARVTPDGGTLLFSSILPLTGYKNGGGCTFGVCSEIYRYRAGVEGAAGSLVCVSCDPSGAPPAGEALLEGEGGGGGVEPSTERALTRNLSEDGDRVVFQTPDALLASDTNKETDVYEWESDGEGSCHSETQDHGCLFLISTGNSSEQSYFADASVNGDSVFVFTREDLTHVDSDENVHLYNGCVDCGKPCDLASEECQQRVPCGGEGCLGPVSPPPSPPTPASTTLNGTPPLSVEEVKKVKKLTNAEKLTKALKECRAKRNKHKRTACERAARKHYPVKAKKSTRRVKR